MTRQLINVSTNTTTQELVTAVTHDIREHIESLKEWRDGENKKSDSYWKEEGTVGFYADDVRGLLDVRRLIGRRQFQKAMLASCQLDTAVQSVISQKVWDTVEFYA